MMRTRRWVAGVGVGSLLLMGVVTGGSLATASYQDASPAAEVDDDDPNATPVVGSPLLEPEIGLIEAQEAALAGQDGASVTAVELDGEGGTLVYSVELDNGIEVEIDATTAEVVATEQSDGDDDDEGDDDDDDGEEDEDEPGDVDATDDAEGEEGDDA